MAGSRKSASKVESFANYDKVMLNIRGGNLAELKADALHQACDYFGIESDGANLDTSKFMATPCLFDPKGRPLEYKASVTVYLKLPEDGEDSVDGAEEDSGAGSRPGLHLVHGSDRPKGPKPPKGEDEYEWSDDD